MPLCVQLNYTEMYITQLCRYVYNSIILMKVQLNYAVVCITQLYCNQV